jgi:hypothetical protein
LHGGRVAHDISFWAVVVGAGVDRSASETSVGKKRSRKNATAANAEFPIPG